MLRISKEQMQFFDEIAVAKFRQRLAKYLRSNYVNETSKFLDKELEDFIKRSENAASKYGVITELGITQWACLGLIFGEDFPIKYDLTDILKEENHSDVTPDEKLEQLVDYLYEQEQEYLDRK